jgi:hypothetical protein
MLFINDRIAGLKEIFTTDLNLTLPARISSQSRAGLIGEGTVEERF